MYGPKLLFLVLADTLVVVGVGGRWWWIDGSLLECKTCPSLSFNLLKNLYLIFLLISKKRKKCYKKDVDFSKILFNIFSSITKKVKNVKQFDIFVFNIFS